MDEERRMMLSEKYMEISPTEDAIYMDDKGQCCKGCRWPLSISLRGRQCRNPACPAWGIKVR